tara:strand:- start:1768 stop:2142 length:375 start_codon:yes stop_codon:yes gene_type:complete
MQECNGAVDDLTLIRTMKIHNETQSSVMDFGGELVVLLDWHAKVVACGFPDKDSVVIVERRDDFNDVVHTLPQSIHSDGVKNLLRAVVHLNMVRRWSEGEMSLSNLLVSLIRAEENGVPGLMPC